MNTQSPGKLTITRIDIYKLLVPLIEPFVISLGPTYAAENALVTIHTDEGLTGFGECSPFLYINGENADTGQVIGSILAKTMIGKNALQIEDHITGMDKAVYGNNSIKSAFDMALYDLASQYAGQPLYQFLGGKKNKTIITDYTVSIGKPEKMAADALKILQQGYPSIKIKLGKDGEMDVQRIKAIREAVGNEIPLRIDANQGWSVAEAITTLKTLSEFGIEHCEEPIPRWDFMELSKVRKESPIPIMADESCGDDHDAERLIALEACDLMNIKLGKSGGIYKALKMAKLAEKAKMHLQVGAFMESRLGMTAFAHFSLCSPAIVHYDFDTCLMFKEDPVTGGIKYLNNGVIEVPEGPGLGATVDESYLQKLKKVTIE